MFIIMDVREGNFSEKTLFSQGERLMKNGSIIEDSSSYLFLMLVFRINSFSMIKEKLGVKERKVYSSRPGGTQQFEESNKKKEGKIRHFA